MPSRTAYAISSPSGGIILAKSVEIDERNNLHYTAMDGTEGVANADRWATFEEVDESIIKEIRHLEEFAKLSRYKLEEAEDGDSASYLKAKEAGDS